MKRLVLGAIFFAYSLSASPVGNTAAPQLLGKGFFFSPKSWIDLRSGYEGDFVYDGNMKQTRQGRGRVDNSKRAANAATITLNFLDRVDLYAVLGSSKAKADWRFVEADTIIHRVEMETRYGFLWGIGGRAILLEWGHSNIGIGGRYSSCYYKPAWLAVDGANISTSGAHSQWKTWQVHLDICYEIELFTPYVGLKYSDAQMKIGPFPTPISRSGSGSNRFENKAPFGAYIGCTLSTGEYFMLNVEGRFIDEQAISLSAELRF